MHDNRGIEITRPSVEATIYNRLKSTPCTFAQFGDGTSYHLQPPFANLLAAPQGACLSKRKADDKAFDESRGKAIIRNAGNLTDIVAEVRAGDNPLNIQSYRTVQLCSQFAFCL